MKKKGFTLVELLAVIAILAILVIMALPAVLRMYRQSRINSFQNEVRTVYRTAQSQFLSDSMLLESGQMIAYTNAGTSVTGVDVVKELDMTGNTDFKYYVLINVDGKVLNVRASNGTYSFSKQAIDSNHDLKIEDVDVETNNDSLLDSDITETLCPNSEGQYLSSLAIVADEQTCNKTVPGCELIIEDESFYVVSSEPTGNTILLAKYDLKDDGNGSYEQDKSGTKTNIKKAPFVNNEFVAYWDEAQCVYNKGWLCPETPEGLISPYSDNEKVYCQRVTETNCAYVYDSNACYNENNCLYGIVNSYVDKIATAIGKDITGRLMTVEEAYNLYLDTNSNDSIKDNNGTNYWLGNAYSKTQIMNVNSTGGIVVSSGVSGYAVRPVIIIATSDL